MVTNQIDFIRVIRVVQAMAALGLIPERPGVRGPLGAYDGPAIMELVKSEFSKLCAELGAEARLDMVELPASVHHELEHVVSDRVASILGGDTPSPLHINALKARLRTIPAPGGRY